MTRGESCPGGGSGTMQACACPQRPPSLVEDPDGHAINEWHAGRIGPLRENQLEQLPRFEGLRHPNRRTEEPLAIQTPRTRDVHRDVDSQPDSSGHDPTRHHPWPQRPSPQSRPGQLPLALAELSETALREIMGWEAEGDGTSPKQHGNLHPWAQPQRPPPASPDRPLKQIFAELNARFFDKDGALLERHGDPRDGQQRPPPQSRPGQLPLALAELSETALREIMGWEAEGDGTSPKQHGNLHPWAQLQRPPPASPDRPLKQIFAELNARFFDKDGALLERHSRKT